VLKTSLNRIIAGENQRVRQLKRELFTSSQQAAAHLSIKLQRLGLMFKILLIESDPLKASLYRSALEERFSDVQRVGDAAEAFCIIEEPRFARDLRLVVSDIYLPGLGAQEFISEFHDRLPNIPVLALGPGQSSVKGAGRRVQFLSRPVGDGQMLAAASQLLAENALLQTA
jgi:CheY-like chemotaxis protein